MRVFLSHCVHDEAIVRRIAIALARARIEVVVAGALPSDRVIERQVLTCERVVVVVSPTLTDPRVARDVGLALRHVDADRVFAFAAPGSPSIDGLPAPFAAVASHRVEAIRDPGEIDQAAARLASAIRCPLDARAAGPRRLPVVERTLRELEASAALHDLAPAAFHDLVRALAAADASYRAKDHAGAADHLEDALTCLAAHRPGFVPYFVRIAQCLCDLQRGFDPTSRLRALEDHPLRDDSWFATVGIVAFRAGRRDEARLRFRTALAECQVRGASELEVFAHLYPFDDDAVPTRSTAAAGRGEAMTVRCVRAARGLARGLPELAAAELQGLPLELHDDASIQLLAYALIELESWSAAIAHLELYVARTTVEPSLSVIRTLGHCYTAIGAVDRAAEVYEGALLDGPDGRESAWIEYARALRLRGDFERAQAICRRVVETEPRDMESYYCVGFAYHLLGDRAAADAMFHAGGLCRPHRGDVA